MGSVVHPTSITPFRALVVAASPAPSAPALVARLARTASCVIAADAGAAVCRAAGVPIDAWVGDADSATSETATWACKTAGARLAFPPEKDDTDLSLAVAYARDAARDAGACLELTLTCAAGGRPDHALGVLGVLVAAADVCPRQVEDAFECRILSPDGVSTWSFDARDVGATVSAIALAPNTVASELGLRWELSHESLPLLGDRGISNVITSQEARVTCHAGTLACFLLTKHA